MSFPDDFGGGSAMRSWLPGWSLAVVVLLVLPLHTFFSEVISGQTDAFSGVESQASLSSDTPARMQEPLGGQFDEKRSEEVIIALELEDNQLNNE